MTTLHAVAYVSTSAEEFDQPVIEELLSRSRRSNYIAGITGVLLYCNGSFMQYFEGPTDAVKNLYSKVASDRRHYGVIEILNTPINELEFAQWSMGYAEAAKKDFEAISRLHAMGSTNAQRSAIRDVLQTFWRANTVSRAYA